jgi:hypothetical protein
MRKVLVVGVMAVLLVAGNCLSAQSTTQQVEDDAAKNAKQARDVLDAMVQALGGQSWLDMKNRTEHGHVAGFFHGQPDVGTTEILEFHSWPDKDRIDVTKHRDYVQFFVGRSGFEVTYRGKKAIPQEQVDDFLRRRDHSIEMAVKVWLKDPKTILVFEGQHLVERHLAEQVTLISAENEAITILTDVQTHLPLRRSFQYRDPTFHDKDVDAEEYDDWHVLGGFPTAMRISRMKNDDMVRQFYVDSVKYNQDLAPDFWSVDAAEKRIKK